MDPADYLHTEDGESRLLARHDRLDDVDLRAFDLDQVDLRCSHTHWLRAEQLTADVFNGWNLFSYRPQFNDSRFGRLNLRGIQALNPVRLKRVQVEEDLVLYDADIPYADIQDGFIGGDLKIRGETTGRIDLRGAGVGKIETLLDDLDNHRVMVDEDTYIHDVPDELAGQLGYRNLSESAASLLKLAAAYECSFTYEELQEEYKSAPAYQDYLPGLLSRNFLEHTAQGYQVTQRGDHAARFLDNEF